MTIVATFDWTDLGKAIAGLFIGFMLVWQKREQTKMQKTVDVIHTLTNSRMGDELLTALVSAKLVVELKPTPENIALCAVAEKKYLDHQMRQTRVDDAAAHEKQAHASGAD